MHGKPLRRFLRSISHVSIVDKQAVKSAIAKNQLLIDVREPSETALGTISTAKLMPLGSIIQYLHLDDSDFKKTCKFDKPKRDVPIIVYCRSGVRSQKAADATIALGYTNVSNYAGSWLDWIEK